MTLLLKLPQSTPQARERPSEREKTKHVRPRTLKRSHTFVAVENRQEQCTRQCPLCRTRGGLDDVDERVTPIEHIFFDGRTYFLQDAGGAGGL